MELCILLILSGIAAGVTAWLDKLIPAEMYTIAQLKTYIKERINGMKKYQGIVKLSVIGALSCLLTAGYLIRYAMQCSAELMVFAVMALLFDVLTLSAFLWLLSFALQMNKGKKNSRSECESDREQRTR